MGLCQVRVEDQATCEDKKSPTCKADQLHYAGMVQRPHDGNLFQNVGALWFNDENTGQLNSWGKVTRGGRQ